jgi:alkanesulfonate monooxygenase SsuD/methylene tetrahydromethanopterin reductase-like flavin-dependent oxidoreductase (luciferase family)
VQFPLQLGLHTFGDLNNDPSGEPQSQAQTIRNVVEQGALADELGIDFFGIGEHHTDYFRCPPATSSSPRSPPGRSESMSDRPSSC